MNFLCAHNNGRRSSNGRANKPTTGPSGTCKMVSRWTQANIIWRRIAIRYCAHKKAKGQIKKYYTTASPLGIYKERIGNVKDEWHLYLHLSFFFQIKFIYIYFFLCLSPWEKWSLSVRPLVLFCVCLCVSLSILGMSLMFGRVETQRFAWSGTRR